MACGKCAAIGTNSTGPGSHSPGCPNDNRPSPAPVREIQFLSQIKAANRAAGLYFFEPDTMRFFKSRALDHVFDGPGGVFFVTSERRYNERRLYTVRRFLRASGDVKTHGRFQGFKSRTGAISAARRAAESALVIQ